MPVHAGAAAAGSSTGGHCRGTGSRAARTWRRGVEAHRERAVRSRRGRATMQRTQPAARAGAPTLPTRSHAPCRPPAAPACSPCAAAAAKEPGGMPDSTCISDGICSRASAAASSTPTASCNSPRTQVHLADIVTFHNLRGGVQAGRQGSGRRQPSHAGGPRPVLRPVLRARGRGRGHSKEVQAPGLLHELTRARAPEAAPRGGRAHLAGRPLRHHVLPLAQQLIQEVVPAGGRGRAGAGAGGRAGGWVAGMQPRPAAAPAAVGVGWSARALLPPPPQLLPPIGTAAAPSCCPQCHSRPPHLYSCCMRCCCSPRLVLLTMKCMSALGTASCGAGRACCSTLGSRNYPLSCSINSVRTRRRGATRGARSTAGQLQRGH